MVQTTTSGTENTKQKRKQVNLRNGKQQITVTRQEKNRTKQLNIGNDNRP
jgi:hypothetical protein